MTPVILGPGLSDHKKAPFPGALSHDHQKGSGSLTSTGQIPTPTTYEDGGTYLIQLQVTESLFNIASSVTKTFTIA